MITARLVLDEPPQFRDRRSPRSRRRDDANRGRLQQAARLVDVRQGHVARLQHQRRGTGRHALVRLVHDDATEHAAHDRDQAFRLENAERLAQRRPRHPEPLHQVRLVAERIPLGELPRHDQPAELVGDLLRLLAQPRAFDPALRHDPFLRLRQSQPLQLDRQQPSRLGMAYMAHRWSRGNAMPVRADPTSSSYRMGRCFGPPTNSVSM